MNFVNLTKGQRVALDKDELSKLVVQVSWDGKDTQALSHDFDLDVMAFTLNEKNQCVDGIKGFHFYNMEGTHTPHPMMNNLPMKGSHWKHVFLSEDSTTGHDLDIDEQLLIIPDQTPAEATRIQIWVTIYDAQARNQNFGRIGKANVKIITNLQTYNFDLVEDYSTANAIALIDVYRHHEGWKINALGQAYSANTNDIIKQFGIIAV